MNNKKGNIFSKLFICVCIICAVVSIEQLLYQYNTDKITQYIVSEYQTDIQRELGITDDVKIFVMSPSTMNYIKENRIAYLEQNDLMGFYDSDTKCIYLNSKLVERTYHSFYSYTIAKKSVINAIAHEMTHYRQDMQNKLNAYHNDTLEDYNNNDLEEEAFTNAEIITDKLTK